jgi:hypothetical protein
LVAAEDQIPARVVFGARLGPDEALEIDCPDIRKRAKVKAF